MSLTGSYLNSYRKAGTGNKIHRFAVKGSAKELDQFKEVQGEFFREQEGTPIFFVNANNPDGTIRLIKSTINLTITGGDRPRVVIDDGKDEIRMMQEAQALLPTALATEMAKMYTTPKTRTAAPVAAPSVAAPAVVSEGGTVAELEGAETLGSQYMGEQSPFISFLYLNETTRKDRVKNMVNRRIRT